MRRIGANYIMPVVGNPISNGILTLDDNGVIVEVSSNTYNPQTLEDVDFYEGVLVPGFVNTHCHLELSYMKGILPSKTGLAGFIKNIMESKFGFPEDAQREAIADADRIMWESGIQAVGDISNTTISFETKRKSPIKYVTFLEIFDVLFGVDYKVVVAQAEELYKAAKEYGLEAYTTLHATYSVSDKLFKIYSSLDNTEFMSIHYLESLDDEMLFSKRGKFWELFEDKGIYVDFLNDGSSTNRIVKNIPSERRLLLVHNSNVTESDIVAMKTKYKDLSWALCPQSNLYIEQKLPPINLLKKSGLNLTIGTDSLSSNTELSIISEMHAISNGFGLGFEEILSWATLGGAKALGLEKSMGSFEIGKAPGVVLVEGLDNNFNITQSTKTRRIL